MRTDGHMHLSKTDTELLKVLEEQNIHCMLSSATPLEAQHNIQLSQNIVQLTPTAGIHPWHADHVNWEEMLNHMEKVTIIGEIGMDSVWCHVDLDIQERIFRKQLMYATDMHKPVVLHTKGQEKKILDLISCCPNTYLVHWYSCMDYLEQYCSFGCYFTIGPSLAFDPAVQQVADMVPLDHLMVETDGLSAAEWALHQPVSASDYPDILDHIIKGIAVRKKVSFETVQETINQNFLHFINSSRNES